MSETSERLNIYEEDLSAESSTNLSKQELDTVPNLNENLLAVYLNDNKLTSLPDDFFTNLPNLLWLDLRNNRLSDIPKSIKSHPCLTHLLLQNNSLTSLPNELGTVPRLKVLQIGGNPLVYPSKEIINSGTAKLLKYLHEQYLEQAESQSILDSSEISEHNATQDGLSYNSVLDLKSRPDSLSVKVRNSESDGEVYSKTKGKCPRLDKSRRAHIPGHFQGAKYVQPEHIDSKRDVQDKVKEKFLRKLEMEKRKNLITKREKIVQGRRNQEVLKNWRHDYRQRQIFCPVQGYKLDVSKIPFDTSPEYMTLLTREDIKKDLPDKYRRSLVRRCKSSAPRKNNTDVHLAMKIKKLFENLEAIDLNRDIMTPRTEQKVLLNEIRKITEIKQKLAELSTKNALTNF